MDLPTRGRTRVSLTGDSELDHFWGGRDFMLQPVQVSCSRKEGDQVTSSGHGVAGLLLHDLCPCNCSMLDQIDTDLNWSQRNAEANHFPDLFSVFASLTTPASDKSKTPNVDSKHSPHKPFPNCTHCGTLR
eukprot:134365-Amorphochlora_amoeboformis.AAC.1